MHEAGMSSGKLCGPHVLKVGSVRLRAADSSYFSLSILTTRRSLPLCTRHLYVHHTPPDSSPPGESDSLGTIAILAL